MTVSHEVISLIIYILLYSFSQCTAKSDTTTYGTCFTSSECGSKGGTTDGNCASGFGVCCIFKWVFLINAKEAFYIEVTIISSLIIFHNFRVSSCSSSVTNNCTYIQNPSYPTTYTTTGSCKYTVTPVSAGMYTLFLKNICV